MAEEVDATFHKVFSDISSANLVRLIPWCISTTTNHDVIPIHHLSEALTTTRQPGVDASVVTPVPGSEGSQALAPTRSPVHHSETPPPPILPLLDVPYISILPVGHSLVRFLINPQHEKLDHSPKGAPDDQPGKRAHAETTEAKASSGCSTLQGGKEPPGIPLEAHEKGTGANKSTKEHNNRNSIDHSGDESTQDESRENAADSDLESSSGDCLTCSDMEELAIRTAQKRFWKRVKASCSIMKGCLWSKAQLRQIKDLSRHLGQQP